MFNQATQTALIPTVWSARITHFLGIISAFLPHANRQWEGDAVYGATVRIPTVDRGVVVNSYDRTADLGAPEVIAASHQDLAIDQEKYFSFAMEDLDSRQSRIGGATLIDIKSQGAGIALATDVDNYCIDQHQGITDADLAYNAARADFDLDFVAEVKKQATLVGLPVSSLVAITTPEVIAKIDKGLIDKTYGDNLIAARFSQGATRDPTVNPAGFAVRVAGLNIFVSPSVKLRKKVQGQGVAAPDANTRGTISEMRIFSPLDFALVMQVNKTEIYRLEKRFATGVKGLLNYGAKVLNAGRMMKLLFND